MQASMDRFREEALQELLSEIQKGSRMKWTSEKPKRRRGWWWYPAPIKIMERLCAFFTERQEQALVHGLFIRRYYLEWPVV